ncbi:MAG: integrase, partial [Rickettsiaceae bacterium 4572_127]
MGLSRQAKTLTEKQQKVVLDYLEKTRHPVRNALIFLLSFKSGLRAKEIA